MKQKGIASFYKDFLTLGVGTFLYMLVGVIGTPVITRLVDPVDYGQMSMLTVYSNFGLMACGLGACLCCVEKTTEGNLCVCKEGPVMNIKKLLWQI